MKTLPALLAGLAAGDAVAAAARAAGARLVTYEELPLKRPGRRARATY